MQLEAVNKNREIETDYLKIHGNPSSTKMSKTSYP